MGLEVQDKRKFQLFQSILMLFSAQEQEFAAPMKYFKNCNLDFKVGERQGLHSIQVSNIN